MIVSSLSSDLLSRDSKPQEWFLSDGGLKYLLNICPHLLHVCLPKILLIMDFLSTFRLNTHVIFWLYFNATSIELIFSALFPGIQSHAPEKTIPSSTFLLIALESISHKSKKVL